MTSQSGQQIISIHIFPKISRSKSHQTLKFGQLIEYSMGNFFKSCTKCGGPKPFYKKSELRISLDQQSKML